jgi:hypothetical protein
LHGRRIGVPVLVVPSRDCWLRQIGLILIQGRGGVLEHTTDQQTQEWKDDSVPEDAGQSPVEVSEGGAKQAHQAERAAGRQANTYDRFCISALEGKGCEQQR